MNTIKLKYKKDRKVFVPDKEVDLPDNFEVELPEIKESTPIDMEKIIKEIEVEGRKYFPDFKLNPQVKELLGLLRFSEFRGWNKISYRITTPKVFNNSQSFLSYMQVILFHPLSKLSDEELKAIYHENVWRPSDEKYNRVTAR